jgi:hypothetical protein
MRRAVVAAAAVAVFVGAALAVVAAPVRAWGDASAPPKTEELRTHAPPPPPPPAKRESETRASSSSASASAAVAPREWRDSDGPMDFVDATLEVADVSPRFRSSRPVVKLEPPRRKVRK